jgi:predicted ATPase
MFHPTMLESDDAQWSLPLPGLRQNAATNCRKWLNKDLPRNGHGLQLIALTGGPGAGKTTVTAALRERGYDCVSDSTRAIMQERISLGLSRRPPAREFAEQILIRETAQYRSKACAAGPVFFDRCVLDALGMLDQLGALSTMELQALLAEHSYFQTAFIFPPWAEIYAKDDERDQTFADAVAVHATVTAWYRRCGYDLVEVPRGTVHERCKFILQRVA